VLPLELLGSRGCTSSARCRRCGCRAGGCSCRRGFTVADGIIRGQEGRGLLLATGIGDGIAAGEAAAAAVRGASAARTVRLDVGQLGIDLLQRLIRTILASCLDAG